MNLKEVIRGISKNFFSTSRISLLSIAICCFSTHSILNAKDFIYSYPRCGNTWMRYSLEYLTKRASKMLDTNRMNRPLGELYDLGLDYKREPFYKAHDPLMMEKRGPVDPKKDRLIFVIRDYRECLTNNLIKRKKVAETLLDALIYMDKRVSTQNRNFMFFENLKLFDKWPEENKILVYYEDLLLQPKKVLSKVLDFLQESSTHLDLFIENLAHHKQNSLQVYDYFEGTASRGENLTFHQESLDPLDKKLARQYLLEKYPELSRKYLKRYLE